MKAKAVLLLFVSFLFLFAGCDSLEEESGEKHSEEYQEGYNEGHDAGYEYGYDVGYEDGFDEGKKQGRNNLIEELEEEGILERKEFVFLSNDDRKIYHSRYCEYADWGQEIPIESALEWGYTPCSSCEGHSHTIYVPAD